MNKYIQPEQTPIVVVYLQPRKRKPEMKIFRDLKTPDTLITNRSNKIPRDSEILDIGVGKKFKALYKKKHKI
jgi:hypothetical protein